MFFLIAILSFLKLMIDAFYYCPHQPQDNCDCRKPKTGLIKKAAKDFDIDIKKSIVIGDRDDVDGEMARRLKMKYKILKRKETLKYNSLKVALVLAGGKGTRLWPITKKIPKPLIDVNGKPTIYYVMKELAANDIKEIYVSLGYKANKLINYLNKMPKKGYKISYVVEKTPLGTGGAVKLGINAISKNHNGDILILNGDDLFKLNIRKMYLEHLRNKAILTLSAKKAKYVSASGVIAIKGNRITKFVEKPEPKDAPSNIINTGKYIVNVKILNILPKKRVFMFERYFLSNLNYKKFKVCYYLSQDKIYGVDTPEKLARARKRWKS